MKKPTTNNKVKTKFFNSLYWKIGLTFLVILLLLSTVYIYISVFTAEMYFQEASQRLNDEIAPHIAEANQYFINGEPDKELLKAFFKEVVVINPAIEVYLLDKKGKIIKNLSFTKAVNFILNDIGYKSYAIKYYEINGIDLELLEDVISEFLGLFPENSTLEEGFKQYYTYLSLIDSINFKVDSGVLLTTVHGAKGLEKDNVFIVSLNEGYFPHKRASLENELEEERRLMYVALTRSKKNLYLSYIKSKTKDLKPSVFLDEIKYK